MRSVSSLLIGAAIAVIAAPCLSQSPPASAGGVVHQLPGVVSTSPEILGSIAAIRQMANGNVLVNDQASRRVLLLDPALKLLRIAADSTPNTNNAYGGRAASLIGYRGDSALFIDP